MARGRRRAPPSGLGATVKPIAVPSARDDDEPYAIRPLWYVKQSTGKAFVDFQNDVTLKDLPLAAARGLRPMSNSPSATRPTAWRPTRASSPTSMPAASSPRRTGRSVADVGTTTFRPFYTPVSFGALAGAFARRSFPAGAQDAAARLGEEMGAVFVETGLWLRSSWFPLAGEGLARRASPAR